ncbi:hypothetical protein KIPB_016982, partial [Kipferlia bialata]|eukprot:g16982.t1
MYATCPPHLQSSCALVCACPPQTHPSQQRETLAR